MSVSPVAKRFIRWHARHTMAADTVIALCVLLLDIPIAFIPQFDGFSILLTHWLNFTIPLWIIAGAAMAFHRRTPVLSWLVVTLAPAVYLGAVALFCPKAIGYSYYVNVPITTITMAGIPLTLAALASRYRMAWGWVTCAVSTIITASSEVIFDGVSWASLSGHLSPYVLLNVIGTLVGITLRTQRLQMQQLQERSARMSLAREQEMRLAAANERSRIAREMHDIVAHSLAVMITMADGASAAVDRNPAMAKEALGVLAETGRSALADTRRLVGVLRDDPGASSDPAARGASSPVAAAASPALHPAVPSPATPSPLSPQGDSGGLAPAGTLRRRKSRKEAKANTSAIPVVRELPVPEFAPPGTVAPSEPSDSIAALRATSTDASEDTSTGEIPLAPAPDSSDLTVLVDRFRAAGVPVEYRWEGRPLPEDKGLNMTLFRIAQESLTNVLRYAPMTKRVVITVTRSSGCVLLSIENDAAPGTTPVHGSGKGLIGMRERAAVYAGTVDAGPTATGWQVRAVLRWDEDDEGTSPWQLPQ